MFDVKQSLCIITAKEEIISYSQFAEFHYIQSWRCYMYRKKMLWLWERCRFCLKFCFNSHRKYLIVVSITTKFSHIIFIFSHPQICVDFLSKLATHELMLENSAELIIMNLRHVKAVRVLPMSTKICSKSFLTTNFIFSFFRSDSNLAQISERSEMTRQQVNVKSM